MLLEAERSKTEHPNADPEKAAHLFAVPDHSNINARLEENAQKYTFSYFNAPATNTSPSKNIRLLDLYNLITSGLYKQQTDRHRVLPKNKTAASKRTNFDYITPNGTFSERGDKNLLTPSSYFIADIDDQGNPQAIEDRMRQDTQLRPKLFFRSPSNNGIKAIYEIDPSLIDPEADSNRMHIIWEALNNYFKEHYSDILTFDKKGNCIDRAGKDLSRACFVCYDPACYYNPEYGNIIDKDFVSKYGCKDQFSVAVAKKVNPATSIKDLYNRHLLGDDIHTPELYSFVCACIRIGEDQETVLSYLRDKVNISPNSSKSNPAELEKLIVSAYAQHAQQTGDLIKLTPTLFAKGILIFKYSREVKSFVLSGLYYEGVRQLLHNAGFAKRYTAPRMSIYIQQTGAIIKEVSTEEMRDHLTRYVEQFKGNMVFEYQGNEYRVPHEAIREIYLKNSNNIFNKLWLEHLQPHTLPILKDTRKCTFLFFQNALVEVTADGTKKREWKEVTEYCVWEDQLIKRDFEFIKDYDRGKFATFMLNVNNNDLDRFMAMISAVGYLMNYYFLPSAGQAVVFYDESITDLRSPQGGSGKGLIANALKQMRSVAKIDGKHFDAGNRFRWELVTPSTQIVWIDDTKPDFDFNTLFSNLTDGWTVERKHLNQFQILPEDSPKVLICSNSIIKNTKGSSAVRRLYVYELSDHYSRQIIRGDERPIEKEHGGIFFSEDWSAEEWNLFYSFMCVYAQAFLAGGVQIQKSINVEKNRLLQRTNEEFLNWCEDQGYETGISYKTQEHYLNCRNAIFGETDVTYKQRKFTDWMKLYADFKGWGMTIKQSHSVPFFEFSKK